MTTQMSQNCEALRSYSRFARGHQGDVVLESNRGDPDLFFHATAPAEELDELESCTPADITRNITTENTVLAMIGSDILALSIDENGFEVDDQGFQFSNIFPIIKDRTYSYELNGKHVLCIGKCLFQYDIRKKMWSKLPNEMEFCRVGAACVSINNQVIIAGGSVNGVCTCSVDLLNSDFSTNSIGILPQALKFHTLTKISETEFILCGGLNELSNPVSDVYYGCLCDNGNSYPLIKWAVLQSLHTARFKHCAIYMRNRVVVVGGVPNQKKCKDYVNSWGGVGWSVNPTIGSPLKKKNNGEKVEFLKLKSAFNKWRSVAFTGQQKYRYSYVHFLQEKCIFTKGWEIAKDLPFFMSRASAVVSPDEKYAVLVYGEDNGSSSKIVLLDAKTLGIQVFNREDDVAKKLSA